MDYITLLANNAQPVQNVPAFSNGSSLFNLAQYGVLGVVCIIMMYAVRHLFTASSAERKETAEAHAAERKTILDEAKAEREKYDVRHREERTEWKLTLDEERKAQRQQLSAFAERHENAIINLTKMVEDRKTQTD